MARVYDRFMKQRLTRRRLLGSGAGAVAGAAGLAIVGCGDMGGTGNGTSTAAMTPAGQETPTLQGLLRLRQPTSSPLPSLSPFGPTALLSSLIFGFTTYDHLWYVPIDTGEIELMLAENIEVVDEQGLETVVTMKEAFYHDKPPVNGRQVLASDVAPSWIAFRDDPFGLGRQWLREIMESIEATNDRTVVIRQRRPFAWMFGASHAGSAASSSILPVETLDEDMFDLSQDVIGSGRFLLESHRSGENPKLRRFERWRTPGEPFLGGVDFILITNFASAEAQFRAGNIDQLDFQNKLQADRMNGELGDEMTLSSELSRSYSVLMLKNEPPFDDVRVRHALHLAVNREELIQLVELDPAGGEPCGIVPPAHQLYALSEEDLADYLRHNVEEARALLEEASFPFDQEFPLKFPTPGEETVKRAQVLRDQLSRVGVKVRLVDEDLLTVWLPRTLNQGEFQMTTFSHLPYEDPSLPLAFFSNNSPIGPSDEARGRNNMGFFDDDIIAAVSETELELDFDARIEKVKEAQRVIMSKWPPMINLYSPVSFTGRRHWYKGWVTGRGSFALFNGRAWIDTSLGGASV